jgi:hypothetical protein
MTKESSAMEPRADLQTAQNRMFPFVEEALRRSEKAGDVSNLLGNPAALKEKHEAVRQQLFDLLCLPAGERDRWHMGIADSGKRTIELLVNFLCPDQTGRNAIVNTENYVGFNKFSAAKSLEKQKGVAFETPFNIALGSALTVNANAEVEKLEQYFKENRFDTLWVSWNSTSTGIRERIGQIVHRRNAVRSKTLIVADAASLRLFSNDWNESMAETLPDVFFFSLRKQGLPYDGPNDEFHQAQNSGSLIIFNDHALKRAESISAGTIYDSPTFAEYVDGRVTSGEQRANHVRHLLKLDSALTYFLGDDRERLAALDTARKAAQSKIRGAFVENGNSTVSRFSLFSDPDAQSDSAYILKVPESTSAKKVITRLKEDGVFISACMHPKMDGQRYVRFAFYPGNTTEEVDCLLEGIKSLT